MAHIRGRIQPTTEPAEDSEEMNDNIKEIGTDYSIVHSQTEHMKVMTRNELRVTGEPLNNIISDKEQGKGGYEP